MDFDMVTFSDPDSGPGYLMGGVKGQKEPGEKTRTSDNSHNRSKHEVQIILPVSFE